MRNCAYVLHGHVLRKFAGFLMARSFILLLIIVIFRSTRKFNFIIIIQVINDGSSYDYMNRFSLF